MNKILAFTSSPRENSNSTILANYILKGIQNSGLITEKINISRLKINPCRACMLCKKSQDLTCAIDDDITQLLPRIINSKGFIFASPVYFFSVNAQMKIFLDRWFAFLKEGYKNSFRTKKTALAFTYGDSEPLTSGVDNCLKMFKSAAGLVSMEIIGLVHASCRQAGEINNFPDILHKAESLGIRMAEKII